MAISADELRDLVLAELGNLGFTFDEKGDLIPPTLDKSAMKTLHKPSREIALQKAQTWIKQKLPSYQQFFANGEEITPQKIKPRLVRVVEHWQSDLFRIARYYWSLPYTYGFGRRLRYLILDDCNNKLIGIFGLQSPPLDFPARDSLFKYPSERKTELINQMMDIYTLGALPPYNRLLGGKLVALAVTSNEVREDYIKLYSGRATEMEGRIIPAHLVALTTTSAYGRSSIYNRLKYKNLIIAESLGYTLGYGNFHLQRLYPLFKEFLGTTEISVEMGYGTGPRRTWQIFRQGLNRIGLRGDVLKHGIKREAFLFPLIDNLKDYLEGRTPSPLYRDFPFENLAEFWKKRWLTSRAERVDGWHKWDKEEVFSSLILPRPEETVE